MVNSQRVRLDLEVSIAMGVPQNSWMVYFMENDTKIRMRTGGFPQETTIGFFPLAINLNLYDVDVS